MKNSRGYHVKVAIQATREATMLYNARIENNPEYDRLRNNIMHITKEYHIVQFGGVLPLKPLKVKEVSREQKEPKASIFDHFLNSIAGNPVRVEPSVA